MSETRAGARAGGEGLGYACEIIWYGPADGVRERAPAKEVKNPANPSPSSGTLCGSDVMDTPEALTGKRERAPVEGVADSDIPTQSADKTCRGG